MDLSLKIKYILNDAYNSYYVFSRGISDNQVESLPDASQGLEARNFNFMTVWLKNISRMMKASNLGRQAMAEMHFLDVGCGKAVSTIFVKEKYPFKSVGGFDIDARLLDIAKYNIENSKIADKEIKCFHGDASQLILLPKRYFLFMFNPFSAAVLRDFLKNNISVLREQESMLAYANARELDVIKEFLPKKIIEIKNYRCAVAYF